MTPAEIAAKVAAQKSATLAKLQPMKQAARQAARALSDQAAEMKQAAKNNQAERELVTGHNFDLFPTPASLAAEMVQRANIRAGDRVLEPSAGTGRIAEAILSAGVAPVCVELNQECVRHLERKFQTISADFMEYAPLFGELFDAVIMNPPFSNGQDIDHVQRAYTFLADGGRLVAIMSEGSFFRQDRKATAFREWLDAVGGYSEQLSPGTFQRSGTNVNSRLVIIHK